MEDLFSLLDKKRLTDDKQVESIIMDKWSFKEVLDFNENLTELIRTPSPVRHDIEKFHFFVNSSLSAQPWGACVEWSCRLRSVDNLSRFAALYADSIYIQDVFDSYEEKISGLDEFDARYLYAGNLKVLNHLKPLIKSGIVHLVKHPVHHICPACMAREFPNLNKEIKQVEKHIIPLTKHYLRKTSASVFIMEDRRYKSQVILWFKGPPDIVHNGQTLWFPVKIPSWVKQKIKCGIAHEKNLKAIKLTKKEILRTGFIQSELHTALQDILLQKIYSLMLGLNAKYLTDRDADFLILNSMTEDTDFLSYNDILTNTLLYEIPIIHNVPIEYLLKIRNEDYDAFLNFRNSITHIIKTYIVQRKPISRHDAKQVYEDEIYPKVCELNNKVNSIRSLAVKKMVKDLIISASIITIGLFSGIFPAGIKEVLTGMGLLKPGKDLSDSVFNVIHADSEIRNENLYFLWKIKKQQK